MRALVLSDIRMPSVRFASTTDGHMPIDRGQQVGSSGGPPSTSGLGFSWDAPGRGSELSMATRAVRPTKRFLLRDAHPQPPVCVSPGSGHIPVVVAHRAQAAPEPPSFSRLLFPLELSLGHAPTALIAAAASASLHIPLLALYWFSTLDTVTLLPSSIFLAHLNPHSCARLPCARPGVRPPLRPRQSTFTESETRNARGVVDMDVERQGEEGRRDGLERRRGGGIRMGMRGRGRERRQEAGGGDEVVLRRSASVARPRYGSNTDGVEGGGEGGRDGGDVRARVCVASERQGRDLRHRALLRISLPPAGTIVCVAGARDAAGLGEMRDPLCAIGPRAVVSGLRLTPVVRRRLQRGGLVILRAAASSIAFTARARRARVLRGWARKMGSGGNGSRVRRAEEKREEGHANGRLECGSTRTREFPGQFAASPCGGCPLTSLPRLPPSCLLASKLLRRSTFNTDSTPLHHLVLPMHHLVSPRPFHPLCRSLVSPAPVYGEPIRKWSRMCAKKWTGHAIIDHLIWQPEAEERRQVSTKSGSTLIDPCKAQKVEPRESHIRPGSRIAFLTEQCGCEDEERWDVKEFQLDLDLEKSIISQRG
ncbi:hypothetical protein FB451DRAFT_1195247 [Mycena latifolia]|nr:hypothetical protein FB451DRAFT_1195247 [Mycena latifolia]